MFMGNIFLHHCITVLTKGAFTNDLRFKSGTKVHSFLKQYLHHLQLTQFGGIFTKLSAGESTTKLNQLL